MSLTVLYAVVARISLGPNGRKNAHKRKRGPPAGGLRTFKLRESSDLQYFFQSQSNPADQPRVSGVQLLALRVKSDTGTFVFGATVPLVSGTVAVLLPVRPGIARTWAEVDVVFTSCRSTDTAL